MLEYVSVIIYVAILGLTPTPAEIEVCVNELQRQEDINVVAGIAKCEYVPAEDNGIWVI